MHFLCEISNNSTCGTGLVSSNISIHVTLDENEGKCQYKFVKFFFTFQYKPSSCKSIILNLKKKHIWLTQMYILVWEDIASTFTLNTNIYHYVPKLTINFYPRRLIS